MKVWKIAIAGCGNLTETVYLPQMQAIPNARPVAVCDLHVAHARAVAEKFGIPEWYGDIDEMIAKADFEILMNITPIQTHHSINMKAILAGKHLYSQKPIATTVEEASEQIEAARAVNIKFSAAPVHMIRPDIRRAKGYIDSGMIGNISLAEISMAHGGPEYFQFRDTDPTWFFRQGAGALLDMGVHGLHLITGLLGPAKSVGCMASVSEPVRTVRSGALDGMKIIADEIPDNYIISLDFGNGRLGSVQTGFNKKATRFTDGFEIYGTHGTIHIGGSVGYSGVAKVELFLDNPDTGIRGWISPLANQPGEDVFFQCLAIKDLIDAIEQDRPTGLPPEQARHVLEIINAIPQAIAEGKVQNLATAF